MTTDDSLPWSPQRVKYKTAPARLRARKRIASQGTVKDTVLGGLVPFYPKPDPSKAIAEDHKKLKRHKKRRKPKDYGFGPGGSSGGALGVGGSSPSKTGTLAP